jgi:hypothetical protein
MSSNTELSIQALVAALLAQSELDDAALPAPLRNESLPARLFQPSPGEPQRYLNVWDGEGGPVDEFLGAEVIDGGYDIEHRPVIEWVVAGGTKAAREALFDKGLIQIHDAIKRAEDGSYLGGVVDAASIEQVTRGGKGLVTDGLPNTKAAEVIPLLKFTSSRPF